MIASILDPFHGSKLRRCFISHQPTRESKWFSITDYDIHADSIRLYSSAVFKIIAGPTQEEFLVHEALLAESPVFHAMTTLPFIEKEERIIRLPDDEASHVKCMIAWLYAKNFYTPSECELRAQQFRGRGGSQEDALSSTRRTVFDQCGLFTLATGFVTVSSTSETRPNVEVLGTGTEPLTDTERAFAVDLAQIYILGDKYQLPGLTDCALTKLASPVFRVKHPVRFLHLAAVLNLYIPESDARFRSFVQDSLQLAARHTMGSKKKIISSIIENGYMRGGGMLAEDILSAFALD